MSANRYSPVTLLALSLLVSSALAQEIPLGSPMPGQDIPLVNQQGASATLGSLKGSQSTVVVFWGNKCPWTSRYEDRIMLLINELRTPDKQFVLVNSNDGSSFPEENAAASARYASEKKLGAPYLTDSSSRLAKAFGATRAPHVFVFDANATLVYVGAVDDSPGDPGSVKKEYIREVLTALQTGAQVGAPQTKAFGCMIRPVQ